MTREAIYAGGCHCGRVRFEAAADLAAVLACNCSFCTMRGVLWSLVPESRFTLLSGADHLRDYQFHRKVLHHFFCDTCGVECFGTGPGHGGVSYAVNVRCLGGVDIDALSPIPFDGKSL